MNTVKIKSLPVIIFIASIIATLFYINKGLDDVESAEKSKAVSANSATSISVNTNNKITTSAHGDSSEPSKTGTPNQEVNSNPHLENDDTSQEDLPEQGNTETASSPPAQLYDQTSSVLLIDEGASNASSSAN